MSTEEIKSVMNRQAATPKGLERRLQDAKLDRIEDPRQAKKITHPLPVVLTALLAGMTTRARSLRRVEERTAQIVSKHGRWFGIERRIADNTFGKLLPRLAPVQVCAALHRQVKAEHRRGNLTTNVLPIGTAAIDGKHVATLRWSELCQTLELEPDKANSDQVKVLLREHFPHVQLCCPKNAEPYGLVRVHNVTLISSAAAPCIHQRTIPGHTNENGAIPELIDDILRVYGKTKLVEMFTTDAGNSSLKVATKLVERDYDYFMQLKSEHGNLHDEAIRVLGVRNESEADASYTDKQQGCVVTYHGFIYDLEGVGWLDWTHARQIIRVRRIVENPLTGEITVGNRYYVTSRSPKNLPASTCLWLSRGHWRVENETHWSADTQFLEDRRRHAWSRHPAGVVIVALLRMIAMNILAVARRLSRIGYSKETPAWRQVAEHFFLNLCDSILVTTDFDNA
jgi:hypothetical protein